VSGETFVKMDQSQSQPRLVALGNYNAVLVLSVYVNITAIYVV